MAGETKLTILVAQRAYYLRHVRPSVYPYVSTRGYHLTDLRDISYWGLL